MAALFLFTPALLVPALVLLERYERRTLQSAGIRPADPDDLDDVDGAAGVARSVPAPVTPRPLAPQATARATVQATTRASAQAAAARRLGD